MTSEVKLPRTCPVLGLGGCLGTSSGAVGFHANPAGQQGEQRAGGREVGEGAEGANNRNGQNFMNDVVWEDFGRGWSLDSVPKHQ